MGPSCFIYFNEARYTATMAKLLSSPLLYNALLLSFLRDHKAKFKVWHSALNYFMCTTHHRIVYEYYTCIFIAVLVYIVDCKLTNLLFVTNLSVVIVPTKCEQGA